MHTIKKYQIFVYKILLCFLIGAAVAIPGSVAAFELTQPWLCVGRGSQSPLAISSGSDRYAQGFQAPSVDAAHPGRRIAISDLYFGVGTANTNTVFTAQINVYFADVNWLPIGLPLKTVNRANPGFVNQSSTYPAPCSALPPSNPTVASRTWHFSTPLELVPEARYTVVAQLTGGAGNVMVIERGANAAANGIGTWGDYRISTNSGSTYGAAQTTRIGMYALTDSFAGGDHWFIRVRNMAQLSDFVGNLAWIVGITVFVIFMFAVVHAPPAIIAVMACIAGLGYISLGMLNPAIIVAGLLLVSVIVLVAVLRGGKEV